MNTYVPNKDVKTTGPTDRVICRECGLSRLIPEQIARKIHNGSQCSCGAFGRFDVEYCNSVSVDNTARIVTYSVAVAHDSSSKT